MKDRMRIHRWRESLRRRAPGRAFTMTVGLATLTATIVGMGAAAPASAEPAGYRFGSKVGEHPVGVAAGVPPTAAGHGKSGHSYRVVRQVRVPKPHEVATDGRSRWFSSNELAGQGGVGSYRSDKLVGSVNLDKAKIPVVQPNGRLGGPAPTPPEGARHPHGLYFDAASRQVYQVIEHSGLAWNATRTGFRRATTADDESGLLVQIDASNRSRMRVVRGWVLGHASEEVTMDTRDRKLLVGNHEPSPTITRADPDFASVINLRSRSHPYEFIDLRKGMDVQGVGYDRSLNTAYGVSHLGETIFAFDLSRRTHQIKYKVGLRAAFDAAEPGVLPRDWLLHMHDLTVDPATHRVYASVHTLGPATADVETGENADEEGTGTGIEPATEKRGEYVIALNASPRSHHFRKVSVIATPGVHAHFLAVDSRRKTLFVTGEHTGNLGVVDLRTGKLVQTVRITPPNPGDPQAEPEVHGVAVNPITGTVYVADETSWHMTVSTLTRSTTPCKRARHTRHTSATSSGV